MRAAVVGLGTIGTVHAQILRTQERAALCAVCDIDPVRLAPFPDVARYTDYTALLREARPDVVHICTPHDLHAPMVLEALAQGIHVLCEKPLCIRTEDIGRILSAERASRAQLGVCFQNRYNPENRFVKEYLEGKRVTSAFGYVAWRRDAAYYQSGAWRGRRETEGGGVLINQAIHTLDLLAWFAGEPDHVTASVSNLTLRDTIEVEDTVSALYEGKGNFAFFASNGAAESLPVEIVLHTDAGILRVFEHCVSINGTLQTFRPQGTARGKTCYGTGHEALIDDFYACIAEGRPFPIDGAEGARAVRMVLGAYASGGRKVRL